MNSFINEVTSTFTKIIIIGIIIIAIIGAVFIWGYNKFAKPVYEEAEDLGYGQYETVWIDEKTGEKIPKDELYKYPEIYNKMR